MAVSPDPAAAPRTSRPGRDEDPMLGVVAGLIAKLQKVADQPDAVLTCDDLLALVGSHSHVLAMFIFALLNLLPAPPGYNFFMALIITAVAFAMLFGREIRLAKFFGQMKLPIKVVMKLLGILSKLAEQAAKISAPRLFILAGSAARPGVAIIGTVMGVAMFAPIPFTNMLPSIGLAVVCVGLLNYDGLLVVVGAATGVIGLLVLAACVWLILVLGFAVEDAIDGEPPVPVAAASTVENGPGSAVYAGVSGGKST